MRCITLIFLCLAPVCSEQKSRHFVTWNKTKYLGPYRVSRVKRNDRYDLEKVDPNSEGSHRTTSAADSMKRWPDTLEYDSFDLYYLWRVGVNIFNVDRTKHDEEFYKNITVRVKEARTYNAMGHYRPIGVAVTVSAKQPVEIDADVDVIIVKDIANKDDLTTFRTKYSKYGKPIFVWISSYSLDDLYYIVKQIFKLSDGVILDFYDERKVIQVYCTYFIKKCREVHKPIIISRPALIDVYVGKVREIMPISKTLLEFNLDGILLEDDRNAAALIDGVYNILCSMAYVDQARQENGEEVKAYFEMRAELKIPLPPSLSLAHGASLAAIQCGAPIIIVLTKSGRSAKWISCANPPCYIMAITKKPSTARQLHVYKKIMPLVYDKPSAVSWQEESCKRIQFGVQFAMKLGLLGAEGAKLVVMSTHGGEGYCNSFQILDVPKVVKLT